MTNIYLTEESINYLIGRKIVEAEQNWIKLDDGFIMYLPEDEIEMTNSIKTP